MRVATRDLLNMTAADLMTTRLVLVPQAMSLQGAARMLSRAGISGAPVIDPSGRCVGVLSAGDFVHWAEKGQHAVKQERCAAECTFYSAWQLMEPEKLPQDEVSRYMTSDIVTAAPDASIDVLARMMVDAHVHRVIVIDAEHRPVGIISSTDILAAVAYSRGKGSADTSH